MIAGKRRHGELDAAAPITFTIKKADSDECQVLLSCLSPLQPRGPAMGCATHSEQIFPSLLMPSRGSPRLPASQVMLHSVRLAVDANHHRTPTVCASPESERII